MASIKRALVLLAKGSEELEVVTVVDVLRRASIHVMIAGVGDNISPSIQCSNEINIVPDCQLSSFGDRDKFDMLVLPGGSKGSETFCNDKTVLQLVQSYFNQKRIVGAICAAPTVIKAANIASGYNITSYPGYQNEFTNYNYKTSRVVKDRNLITSRGPGTAIDFALTLVEELVGSPTREKIAREILATFAERE